MTVSKVKQLIAFQFIFLGQLASPTTTARLSCSWTCVNARIMQCWYRVWPLRVICIINLNSLGSWILFSFETWTKQLSSGLLAIQGLKAFLSTYNYAFYGMKSGLCLFLHAELLFSGWNVKLSQIWAFDPDKKGRILAPNHF